MLSKHRTMMQQCRVLLALFAAGLVALAVFLHVTVETIDFIRVDDSEATRTLLTTSVALLLVLLGTSFYEHEIWKGIEHYRLHRSIKKSIQRELVDAGFFVRKSDSNIIVIPKVQISFSDDYMRGTIKIQNTLAVDRKLDGCNLSPAIGRFVVDKSYLSTSQNYYIFEIYDSTIDLISPFSTAEEFLSYSNRMTMYTLFINKSIRIPVEHMLLVGQTGSGKSYAMYSLILQALNKPIHYHLYIADPKGSALAAVAEKITEHQASEIEDIISLLDEYVEKMEHRKQEMKMLLQRKLDADYTHFALEPYVFIIDELASFLGTVQRYDKKTRDHVNDLIGRIILQGRQLGFFIWIAMQKSDSSIINTAFRDNLPFKTVLGSAEDTTYVTTFGAGAEIPNRHFRRGEGVYTEPTLTEKPSVCGFPTLDFDILDAIVRSSR